VILALYVKKGGIMSFAKRFMEEQEERDALIEALKTLVENDVIQHAVSLGITKKIIADGKIDNLSPKQLKIYDQYIEPLLNPNCENIDCGGKISHRDLPAAYQQQFEVGKLLCEECLYAEMKIRNMKD
jgi:hypothetical protein